jgi:uncharacterized protein (DUF2336 family)
MNSAPVAVAGDPPRDPSPYDGAAGLAGYDEPMRVRLGAGSTTQAEILLRLALDPSVTVRAALALNPTAPPAALSLLARDADERVRILIARKLAALAPSLSDTEQASLHQQTIEALGLLVRDEAIRVRAAIADVVKDMPNAPRELALRLAHDTEIKVSDPVIRLSPLLTQADLLALVAAPNAPALALAVARRPGLTEEVADALAASEDPETVRALLLNRSAQIREATLDALIARAADHTPWHAPLVRRPNLSARAAQALSCIVADTLLGELADRADLPQEVTTELRTRLAARLAQAAPRVGSANERSASSITETIDALAEARSRAVAGQLTEAELSATAGRGEAPLAAAMLAVAAGVPLTLVQRAATLRSAKGLVSLVWKAGFSMKLAVPLQTLLAALPPVAVIKPAADGTFPLAIEEMRWQIEFLGHPIGHAGGNKPGGQSSGRQAAAPPVSAG